MNTQQSQEPLMNRAVAVLEDMGSVTSADLIPLLQRLQESYGYLPPEILQGVSKLTGIPATKFYGVATFYTQFHLEPKGRHTIRCCQGTACHVRGGEEIVDAVSQALGITSGETTEDLRFSFEAVACLGTCFLAPVIMVDNDYYGKLLPDRIPSILELYR